MYRTLALSAALFALGCGTEGSDLEQYAHEDCWQGFGGELPADLVAPMGTVEIGAPQVEPGFAPFGGDSTTLSVETGIQGGYHVTLRARIEGLSPGSTDFALSDENPQTSFAVFDQVGNRIDVANCGRRFGYEEDVTGGDGHVSPLTQLRLNTADAEEFDGMNISILIEVLDCEGTYATHTAIASLELPIEE